MKIRLSIIIVNYNVKHFLRECLSSIFASDIDSSSVEVFVVDNASPDASIPYLKSTFPKSSYPRLHWIDNSRNVGFGRANNQAVRRAVGEYILFLNPDTLLHGETLRHSIDYMDAHPEAGGLGTMMLRDDGSFAYESRRGLPTPWVAFCKLTGLSTLFPKSHIFGRYYMRYLDEEQPCHIDVISGAYFMVRHSLIDKIGAFDEEFFMYGEDVDLSYRITLSGSECHYAPYPMLHYKGESTHKSSFRYVHVFYNAMLIFFRKHFHSYYIGLSLPIRFGILMRALLTLCKGQMMRIREYIFPVKHYKRHKFYYLGSHWQQISALATGWWLDMEHWDTTQTTNPDNQPQLPPNMPMDGYTHVVYDVSDYSYSYILDAFRHSPSKAYIGIYNPDANVLITASRVYEGRKSSE